MCILGVFFGRNRAVGSHHVPARLLAPLGNGGLHVPAVLTHLRRHKVAIIVLAGAPLLVPSRHRRFLVLMLVLALLTRRRLTE